MDDFLAIYQFKRDFIIQTFVQETQFEQWVKSTFYLNQKLNEEFDSIYQEAFYVKLYELMTEGLDYAKKLLGYIEDSNNVEKKKWYMNFIDGINHIKSTLEDSEFTYIEYRRHSASHIFQDKYEHIQKVSLKIKKLRKDKSIEEVNNQIKSLVRKFGSDREIDIYLNKKLYPLLTNIYLILTK